MSEKNIVLIPGDGIGTEIIVQKRRLCVMWLLRKLM